MKLINQKFTLENKIKEDFYERTYKENIKLWNCTRY